MGKDTKYLLQSDDGYVYKKDERYISIPDPSLVIEPSGYTFPVYNSSTYFSVKKSLFVDWNISTVPSWLTYSQKSNGFDAFCNANNTGSARSGNIEIDSPIVSTNSIIVPVSQEYVTPSMTVSPASHTFDGGGGNRQFTVTSNIPWDVSTYPNWITIYSKMGLNGNGYFYGSAGSNTGSYRSGNIVLKSTTSPDLYPAGKSIPVYQPAGRSLTVTYGGSPINYLEWAYNDGYCCTLDAYQIFLNVEVTGTPSEWYTSLIGGDTGYEFYIFPTSYSGSYTMRISMDSRSSFYGRLDFLWSDTAINAFSLYLDARYYSCM